MPNKELKNIAEQSKRYSFIAEHRGGPLTKEQHYKLISWAVACTKHVLPLANNTTNKKLKDILAIAKEWEKGNTPTGKAMKAAQQAHQIASQSEDPINKAIARSVGQTIATAHMADHSLGGAYYALKAVKLAKKDIEKEKEWQLKRLAELSPFLVEIVLAMWNKKELDRRI